MKITTAHIQAFGYWRTPPSLLALVPKMQRPNIDFLVNLHERKYTARDTHEHNAIVLVQLRRRNGATALEATKPSEWDKAQSVKYRYFALRRWHARLLKARS